MSTRVANDRDLQLVLLDGECLSYDPFLGALTVAAVS